jgi:hypothetical protein
LGAGLPTPPLRQSLTEGVGCESCHGPAEHYLATHYLPGWRQQTDSEKERWGLSPTKDLLARARLCAGCHVGDGDRDVNHDLIAAGHPRLTFEFSAFLAVYPKHWNVWQEKARTPDLEARAWALGQAASAQAALELLAHRAETPDRPWPEFGEYDCAACHHDLPGASRHQARQPAGALRWGSWYFPMLPTLAQDESPSRLPSGPDLAPLSRDMGRNNPDRSAVARQARAAAGKLDPWVHQLARARYDGADLRRLLRDVARLADGDWDLAAQVYLALAALYHAQGDVAPGRRDPLLREPLEVMGRQLKPRRDPDQDKAFREALAAVRRILGH